MAVRLYGLITGRLLVAVLHGVGLFLLLKCKSDLPNQRLLLINLAIVEMFTGFFGALKLVLMITGYFSARVRLVERFIGTLLYTRIRFAVLHIIMDRFLEIYLNLRYPLHMNIAKMKILSVCLWVIGIIFATINTILMYSKGMNMTRKFFEFTLVTFDIIIVVTAISTYVFYFLKAKRVRRSENQQDLNRIRKKFILPCYLVTTYILFNFTSMLLLAISQNIEGEEKVQLMFLAAGTLDILAYLSDAFVYIFMNKKVFQLLQIACIRSDNRT